ncbi:hypothetical protein J8273_0843 [Carpediemonas membranifera]|nr:hypothetical protein J8273_0843 [Carpediemonas membranifera]|eukprot:KAG9397359.1 hypothetical protein J8273_0843 [Carpediemonas membranifera]
MVLFQRNNVTGALWTRINSTMMRYGGQKFITVPPLDLGLSPEMKAIIKQHSPTPANVPPMQIYLRSDVDRQKYIDVEYDKVGERVLKDRKSWRKIAVNPDGLCIGYCLQKVENGEFDKKFAAEEVAAVREEVRAWGFSDAGERLRLETSNVFVPTLMFDDATDWYSNFGVMAWSALKSKTVVVIWVKMLTYHDKYIVRMHLTEVYESGMVRRGSDEDVAAAQAIVVVKDEHATLFVRKRSKGGKRKAHTTYIKRKAVDKDREKRVVDAEDVKRGVPE